jgi:hypothetical protein
LKTQLWFNFPFTNGRKSVCLILSGMGE